MTPDTRLITKDPFWIGGVFLGYMHVARVK